MKVQNPVKHRAHFVLFAANSPFKPKSQVNRKAYKRVAKHRKQEQ